MLIVTTTEIVGSEVTETLGLVEGTTVRSGHLGSSIIGFMKVSSAARSTSTPRSSPRPARRPSTA